MLTIHMVLDHTQIAIPVEQMLSRIFSSLPIVGVHREPGNVCI